MSAPLLPFQIEVVPDDDTMTARAGLPLVVEVGSGRNWLQAH